MHYFASQNHSSISSGAFSIGQRKLRVCIWQHHCQKNVCFHYIFYCLLAFLLLLLLACWDHNTIRAAFAGVVKMYYFSPSQGLLDKLFYYPKSNTPTPRSLNTKHVSQADTVMTNLTELELMASIHSFKPILWLLRELKTVVKCL